MNVLIHREVGELQQLQTATAVMQRARAPAPLWPQRVFHQQKIAVGHQRRSAAETPWFEAARIVGCPGDAFQPDPATADGETWKKYHVLIVVMCHG